MVNKFPKSVLQGRLRIFRLSCHKDPSALWLSHPTREAFKSEWIKAAEASVK